MSTTPDMVFDFDERQLQYVEKIRAQINLAGKERAIDRWRWAATHAALGRAFALMQLLQHYNATTTNIEHIIGLAYWYPTGLEKEFALVPGHTTQLIESVVPLLYYFGPDHNCVLLMRDGYLHACIYTSLHADDASDRYDRFVTEWIQSAHSHWTTEIVWDLAVARDDAIFAEIASA